MINSKDINSHKAFNNNGSKTIKKQHYFIHINTCSKQGRLGWRRKQEEINTRVSAIFTFVVEKK